MMVMRRLEEKDEGTGRSRKTRRRRMRRSSMRKVEDEEEQTKDKIEDV
jgi:hypothetical protein